MVFLERKSIQAGFMIGFAALLSCCIENQFLSALFFSIGLLYIRISGLYLYTGQIQNVKNKTISVKDLIFILINNMIGVLFALALFFCWNRNDALTKYISISALKWIYPWYHYLFSGFCCGVLMTIATKKESPLWVSSLCVVAFILAGFNHSIADWFYISFIPSNFILWLSIVIGNFLGGYVVAVRNENK